MQPADDYLGIDVVTGPPRFIARTQATRDEPRLNAATLDAGPHRGFDEFGQGFAFRQHRLHLGAELGLDADGWNGGGLHEPMYRKCGTTLGTTIWRCPYAGCSVVPPDEQESLLSWLEAQSTAFDQLIEDSENAVRLVRERRSALISAATTGHIGLRDRSSPDKGPG